MSEEFLKELIKLKITAADKVVDMLPGNISAHVREQQKKLLAIINEVSGELLKSGKQEPDGKRLNNISID